MDQLRALRVFVQVAAEGSLAGAARVLDLAPAVVTRTLAELEAHLGTRLMHRTTRRLALTEAGENYLANARRILAELDEADAEAGAASAQAHGSLRVLAPPAFAVHQLAPLLPALRARHPQLVLDVATPGPVEAADANFDVSIVSLGQQPLQGDFIARRLAVSTFVLCAAPAYLDRHGRPDAPDALLPHAGLLPAVDAVRQGLRLYHDKSAASAKAMPPLVELPAPRAVLSTSQLELLLAAALAGLGIAGLPSFLAAAALRDGRLERVLPHWHGGALTIYAAMPTRRHLPARTRAFVDFLIEHFGGGEGDPWLAGLRARITL
ncbi:LysR family transcriptional regulator [Aquincola sp. S2]|uniref:LysR family transcriptional regulator n=1 Tax=Pseudaquabacterium terrae TaxID=2732868 RepID=A0ABX2ECQ2_9BURK|nr:LysR family transcriptional regulator [Aquabacterium terrae]NRF65713.1 LysR family transcriptional regulator [Aquabacterium terrae]